MLYALDIETKCAVKDCTDKQCKHALIPHLSEITCIGLWSPTQHFVFRTTDRDSIHEIYDFLTLDAPDTTLLFHNGKFDTKKLIYDYPTLKDILIKAWVADTQLMAYANVKKVPELYIQEYEEKRKEENKKLPKGYSHRDAGGLSLKTLAPYFLGVDPFWEDPTNHDSDEYVLKDCEYTYRLYEYLYQRMDKEDLEFYETRLMPWSKMLLEAELRGIQIDRHILAIKKKEAENNATILKNKLDEQWKDAYLDYQRKQIQEIVTRYKDMASIALEKSKNEQKTIARYANLCAEAVAKIEKQINLDSPAQLKWLLKDYLGLDVASMKEEDKESTGKDVLNRLYNETGREDLKTFLAYREQKKLLTSFIPTYEELADSNGIIRSSFNITGTKTGRLSSSSPNMQQLPPVLQDMFVARPGYSFVYRDESYIEPRLIAYYTEDSFLCDLILRNGDFHSYNAKIMFGLECDEKEVKDKYPKERKLAKTVGLALLYGAGTNRIHQTATAQGYDWSIDTCREILRNFKDEYEHIYRWKEELDRTATQRPIKNLFGLRRMYQPDEIHMQAFNGMVQGSASMLVIDAAFRGAEEFKSFGIDARPIVFVHDAVIWEVPTADLKQCEEVIDRVMTDFPLNTGIGNIPLVIDGHIGQSWG